VPDISRVSWVVKYLDEYASTDINKNWWWMWQAITLSKMVIKDDKTSLKLAHKLSKNTNPDAPYFTKQIPAILHSRIGDHCQSFLIMQDLLEQYENKQNDSAVIDEILFMNIFIKEQLKKLEEANFNPKNCKN
jgi:hypothetical protein